MAENQEVPEMSQDAEQIPNYMVWVTVEGADDSPADNGFEYLRDAIALADKLADNLKYEGITNAEVAIYDTFANQNIYVVDMGCY